MADGPPLPPAGTLTTPQRAGFKCCNLALAMSPSAYAVAIGRWSRYQVPALIFMQQAYFTVAILAQNGRINTGISNEAN